MYFWRSLKDYKIHVFHLCNSRGSVPVYCLWLSNPRYPSQSPLCVVSLQTLANVPGYLPTRLSNQFLETHKYSRNCPTSCCCSSALNCLCIHVHLSHVVVPWPYLLLLSLLLSSSRLSSTITLSFLYPSCNLPLSFCC